MIPERGGSREVEKTKRTLYEKSSYMTTGGLKLSKDEIKKDKNPELFKKLPDNFKVNYTVIGPEKRSILKVTLDYKVLESDNGTFKVNGVVKEKESRNILVGREAREPYKNKLDIFLEDQELIIEAEYKDESDGKTRGRIMISDMVEDYSSTIDSPLL